MNNECILRRWRFLPSCDNLPVDSGQRPGVHRRLHGSHPAQSGQSLHRVAGHLRPVRRLSGHGLRRRQRPAGLLGLRRPVLRHLGRLRRHVLHSFHTQLVRHFHGSVRPAPSIISFPSFCRWISTWKWNEWDRFIISNIPYKVPVENDDNFDFVRRCWSNNRNAEALEGSILGGRISITGGISCARKQTY